MPSKKMVREVQKILKAKGYKFVYRDCIGWKILSDDEINYSWLEYEASAHEDKVKLCVDKLRDGADNFKRLVDDFHGLVVNY